MFDDTDGMTDIIALANECCLRIAFNTETSETYLIYLSGHISKFEISPELFAALWLNRLIYTLSYQPNTVGYLIFHIRPDVWCV